MTTPTSAAPTTGFHVYAAIAAVTAALSREGIAKNRQNKEQRFNFRGIDDIYNSLSGLLAQNHLCIIPRVLNRAESQRQTKSGSILNVSVVEVEYDIISAVDGSKHTARAIGEAQDSADKSTNKAMSAAYKYLCLQLFCIPTVAEDNDADASHVEAAPVHQPVPDPALIAAARAACERAGLTEAGLAAFLHPLSDISEIPIHQLQRLAKAGLSPQTVERCNAAGEHGGELPATYSIQPQSATAAANS